MRRTVAAVLVALAAIASAAGDATARVRSGDDLHDARYCEVIELKGLPPSAQATVWNTIGLNRCPPARWRALDAAALARELGDTAVVLNGPRHFLMDGASAATGPVHSFDGLRARRVATIPIHSAAELAQTPYVDRTIERANSWRWRAGRRVYELVAPGGDVYVMQSYAQIVEPWLRLGDLRALGGQLTPPPGWRYRSRRLDRDMVLTVRRRATVIQDELRDTYQLAKATRRGDRVRHPVAIRGRTHSVPPATAGTVEDRGTLDGTPFGRGSIVLVGRFVGGRLEGSYRLTFPRGSILGTVSLPFKLSSDGIAFHGSSRFTSGTGAFRGITSSRLEVTDHNALDGQSGRLSVIGRARFAG